MKYPMMRLGLSLMLVVGFWANRLPAQELLVVPTVPYEPAHHPYSPPALAVRPLPPPADHLYRRLLNAHGVGCAMDYYGGGCSNYWYEARFIFGSCRTFFGETCVPGQPCWDKRYGR